MHAAIDHVNDVDVTDKMLFEIQIQSHFVTGVCLSSIHSLVFPLEIPQLMSLMTISTILCVK